MQFLPYSAQAGLEAQPVPVLDIHGPSGLPTFHPFSLQHADNPMKAQRGNPATFYPLEGVPQFIHIHMRGVRL